MGGARQAVTWTHPAAFSSAAMSILTMVIIASVARRARSGSGSFINSTSRSGTTCHDRPQRSVIQPHWTSLPPLASMASQTRSVSAWSRVWIWKETAWLSASLTCFWNTHGQVEEESDAEIVVGTLHHLSEPLLQRVLAGGLDETLPLKLSVGAGVTRQKQGSVLLRLQRLSTGPQAGCQCHSGHPWERRPHCVLNGKGMGAKEWTAGIRFHPVFPPTMPLALQLPTNLMKGSRVANTVTQEQSEIDNGYPAPPAPPAQATRGRARPRSDSCVAGSPAIFEGYAIFPPCALTRSKMNC